MKSVTRLFTGVAAAVLLASCSHSQGTFVPPATAKVPLPPLLLSANRNYTVYMFRNASGAGGLATSPPNDGALPKGTLTLVGSGPSVLLYGRTANGGNSSGCGTVFSTGLTFGSSYHVVEAFSGSDGCDPRHDAIVSLNGMLYFTTQGVTDGGNTTYSNGTINAFLSGGVPAVTHAFAGAPNEGAEQHSSLTLDANFGSVLYGQTASGGSFNKGQVYAITPDGSAYYPIHDFQKSEGTEPHGRIIQLGVTLWGITRNDGDGGGGTIFSLVLNYVNGIPQPQPALTVVHAFVAGTSDGYFSDHGYLTAVNEGGQTVLYALTQCGGRGKGGDSHHCSTGGDGTIIRVVPHMTGGQYDGTASYSVFYAFEGMEKKDGAGPFGSLAYDPVSGYMYGTTAYGGGTDDAGTLFRFIPGSPSSYRTVYHFTGKNGDGAKPIDNVVISNGVLYGMTVYGGTTDDAVDGTKGAGNGTIFAIPVP